jgi:hypothetical protein
MEKMSVDAIRNALLQQSLGLMGGADGIKGLLSPTQTPLQVGLLGARQQLAPSTGYTTTPTTFGQAIGAGLMGAASGVQEQKTSDLARALKGLELYSALDTDDDSEFDKQLKEYETLSLIPEDQRTEKQQLRLDVLTDKLRDKPSKDSLSDFTLSVIRKADKEGLDSLSDVEKDAYDRWKKGGGDLFSFLQGASGDSSISQELPKKTDNAFSFAKDLDAQQILNLMINMPDKEAEKLYESLDSEKKDEVDLLYTQSRG